MAIRQIDITLKWENQKFFEMTQKEDANPKITTIRVEENSDIGGLWQNIANICQNDFARHIARAGDEMKA